MATEIGDISDKTNVFKKIREKIEEKFNCILQKVTQRRDALLKQLTEWELEDGNVSESLQELKSSKQAMELLYSTLKFEAARKSMRKSIDELTEQISKTDSKTSDLYFVCETNDFEWRISQLGVLSKTEKKEIIVRDYSSIKKSLVSFGKLGVGSDRIREPRGVLVDESNSRIFVADYNNLIRVWSMDGNYLSEFGKNTHNRPWEIVLHDEFLYISDFTTHVIAKWSSDTFNLKASSNTTQGSKQGQLYTPAGLDTDCGEVFVVEYMNKRVSVFDLDLRFKRLMAVGMLNNSFCLRIRSNTIYIVERRGVIKLFSKADHLLRTVDNSKTFSDYVYHFNFDSSLNFLITDVGSNTLFVLSPDGDLMHSICFQTWGVRNPFGIDVTHRGNLVVSFQTGNSAVVIF